jgi:hypothetical protein
MYRHPSRLEEIHAERREDPEERVKCGVRVAARWCLSSLETSICSR